MTRIHHQFTKLFAALLLSVFVVVDALRFAEGSDLVK